MGDFLKSNIALQELLECYSYKSVVEHPKVSVIIPAYNVEEYTTKRGEIYAL